MTGSAVLRYPGLADSIGPIKATMPGVATKISNFFQAGEMIQNYEQLQGCDIVLLRAPDESLPRIANEIAQSKLPFSSMAFVFCETWLPSDRFTELMDKGASLATIVPLSTDTTNYWFTIEGNFTASKRVKRFLHLLGARTVELKEGSKHMYFAASAFVETLPRALFTAAHKCLQETGLSGKHRQDVIREMAQTMFREVDRGVRGGWSGPLLECSDDVAGVFLLRLQESVPELALLLSEHLHLAEPFAVRRTPKLEKQENRRAKTAAAEPV
jgi:hypothetical protein